MVYIQAISQTSSANTEHLHRLLLVKDLAWFYLRRMGVGVKKPKSNFFLVVNYVNKHVEYINFRKIFMFERPRGPPIRALKPVYLIQI